MRDSTDRELHRIESLLGEIDDKMATGKLSELALVSVYQSLSRDW